MAEKNEAVRTSGIWVVATAAGVWLLYQGQELLVPVVFALILAGIFRPIVRVMQRARVPAPVGAALVVLGLIGVLAVTVLMLSGPVQQWMDDAPASFDKAEVRLKGFRAKMNRATEAANKIEHAVDGPTTNPSDRPPAPAPVLQSPTMASQFFGTTAKLASGLLEVLVLLYLLLSTGDLFYRKVLKLAPHWRDKQTAHDIVDEAQAVVMRYVVVTFLITLGQGVAIAIALWLLGMPNALLWGLLTVLIEFIPYLGAAVMMILLSIAAFATFDSLGHILAVPGCYFLITTIQNNVISPYAYGSKLKLNPVAVLLGVLFWWFVWGIPGAFLAVPIIATFKMIADQTDSMDVLREFLGE